MGSSRLRVFDPPLERKDSAELSERQLPLPTFDVPYFKYIDEEDEDDEWSSRSQSSTEDDSVDSLLSDRYVVVSGTPEKILEHLLNDLHLAEVQHKETGKPGVGGWGLGRGPLPPKQQQQLMPCQYTQEQSSHCLRNQDGLGKHMLCVALLMPVLFVSIQ